jgi:hypothetical protein
MNIPKAIEKAVADGLHLLPLGSGVVVRPFQSLASARGFDKDNPELSAPCIDVRAALPTQNEDAPSLFHVTCGMEFVVSSYDDPDNSFFAKLSETIQDWLIELYSQYRAGEGEVFEKFLSDLSESLGSDFVFSGLYIGTQDGAFPLISDGETRVMAQLTVYYDDGRI